MHPACSRACRLACITPSSPASRVCVPCTIHPSTLPPVTLHPPTPHACTPPPPMHAPPHPPCMHVRAHLRSWRASFPRRRSAARPPPTSACWSTTLSLHASGPLGGACKLTAWLITARSSHVGGRLSTRAWPSPQRWGVGRGLGGRGGAVPWAACTHGWQRAALIAAPRTPTRTPCPLPPSC